MKFKQIVHFLSGTSSRCLILKAFDTFFEDLIGSWIWKVAKQYCIDLWQDIVSKIDKLMESKMDTDYMVTFSLSFIDLEKICAENTNMSLKQILETSEFSTKINYGQMKLRVELVLIKSLFDKCLSKIIREIQHVLVKSDDKEVTTLILAGNIARSGLLIHAIQKAFPSKQIAVSDEANEVALKGAVLFGQLPIVVSSIFSGAQVMVAPKKGHITKVPL